MSTESYPVLLGKDEVGDAYDGVHFLPATFYIGRDGKVFGLEGRAETGFDPSYPNAESIFAVSKPTITESSITSTGVVMNPSFLSSSKAFGSLVMSFSVNCTFLCERYSFAWLQNIQPGWE